METLVGRVLSSLGSGPAKDRQQDFHFVLGSPAPQPGMWQDSLGRQWLGAVTTGVGGSRALLWTSLRACGLGREGLGFWELSRVPQQPHSPLPSVNHMMPFLTFHTGSRYL